MRLCVDCKHFKRSHSGLNGAYFGQCSVIPAVSAVTGEADVLCITMRKTWSHCKPEGLLYEAKPVRISTWQKIVSYVRKKVA